MRHLDLFAGIGGFSRAVEWLGGTTVGFVEWDAWNRRVLAKHWPEARYFSDIKSVGADDISGLGRIDLITGGYPCQPFSHAGKRLGAEDDRHLWPEMRRIIDIARPAYVLAENVAGHINMGLDVVLSDLEADGYACGAVVVPAASVNALHRRDRIWIMAHADSGRHEQRHTRERLLPEFDRLSDAESSFVPHSDSNRRNAGSERQEGAEGATLSPAVTPCELRTDSSRQLARTSVVGGEHAARTVADSERGRRGKQLRVDAAQGALPATERAQGASGTRSGGEDETLADTQCQRQPGQGELGGCLYPEKTGDREAGGAITDDSEQSHTGKIARTLDACVDGLPTGPLRRPAAGSAEPDLIRQEWADGTWEIDLPRVVSDESERRQKLQAAGNAIVPIVAYEILRVMLGETQ